MYSLCSLCLQLLLLKRLLPLLLLLLPLLLPLRPLLLLALSAPLLVLLRGEGGRQLLQARLALPLVVQPQVEHALVPRQAWAGVGLALKVGVRFMGQGWG